MLRVISEVKPKFVVGENVAGIINLSLDQVLSEMEDIGYTTETFVIPACAVNAPHRRDRVWIVGYTEHAGLNGSEDGKGSIERSNGNTNRQNQICEPERSTLSRDASANRKSIISNERGFSNNSKTREVQFEAGRVYGNSNATDTDSIGQSGSRQLGGQLRTKQSEERQNNRAQYENQFERNWFEVASELCRVDDGLPHRVDRIKGLGNAIVPQVAYEIFKSIEQTLVKE
jgi:DNA (cytosine-5)-methyltransferase 1